MVPAHKISAYHHLEEDVFEPPGSLGSTILESLSGGLVVCNGRSKLYAHWITLDKLDISKLLDSSKLLDIMRSSNFPSSIRHYSGTLSIAMVRPSKIKKVARVEIYHFGTW